jgi:hypothetical protein
MSTVGDGHQEAEVLRRLQQEHDLDEAALADTLPEDDRRHSGEAGERRRPTPSAWLGLPRRTRVLMLLVVGGLLVLVGIQLGKLTGGDRPVPATAPGGAARSAPSPDRPGSDFTRGEIVAIAGSTVYVRGPDGRTVALRTTPPPRVGRAQPAAPGDLRPGDAIVAESTRGPDGRLTARSITVLPPRTRPGGRP